MKNRVGVSAAPDENGLNGVPNQSSNVLFTGAYNQPATVDLRKTGGAATDITLLVQNTNSKMDLQGNTINLQSGYLSTDAQTIVGAGGFLNITGDFTQMGAGAATTLGGGNLIATGNAWITGGQFSLGGGTLSAGATVNIGVGATLTNTGVISGAVTNSGTIAIANGGPTGALSILGSFTQGATGTLAITIGGVQRGSFDELDVSGNAVLDGTVSVALSSGFVVAAGDSFDFLSFTGQLTGTFAQVVPQGNATDYNWVLLPPGNDYVAIQVPQ